MLEITAGCIDNLKVYAVHAELPSTPNENYVITIILTNGAIKTNIYGQFTMPASSDHSMLCQSFCDVKISQLARKRLRRIITSIGREIVYKLRRQ